MSMQNSPQNMGEHSTFLSAQSRTDIEDSFLPRILGPHRPEYTGVRALSALMIIATHIAFWTGQDHDTYIGRGLARLEFGVPIFFSLSGFLLLRSWLIHSALVLPTAPGLRGFRSHLWRYICHRFWRIIPAYYVVIFLCMIFSPFFISVSPWYLHRDLTQINPSKFVLYLWFGQIFHPFQQLAGLTHLWSLAVEWDWYIIFPWWAILITWLLGKNFQSTSLLRSWGYVLAIVCVVFAMFLGILLFIVQIRSSSFPWTNFTLYPLGFLAWFAMGLWIALLPTTFRYGTHISWLIIIIGCAISPWSIFGSVAIIDPHLSWAVNKYLLYACVAGAILYLLKAGKMNFLAAPFMVWLGELSYEIFLLHVPILELWMNYRHWMLFQGNPVLLWCIITGVTIPAAWLLYHFQRYLHQLCSRLSRWIFASS